MAYDLSYDYYPLYLMSKGWPEIIQNNIKKAPPYRLFRFTPLDLIVTVANYHLNGSVSLIASRRVNDEVEASDFTNVEEYGLILDNDYDGDLVIYNAQVDHLEDYKIPAEMSESFGAAWTNYVH